MFSPRKAKPSLHYRITDQLIYWLVSPIGVSVPVLGRSTINVLVGEYPAFSKAFWHLGRTKDLLDPIGIRAALLF